MIISILAISLLACTLWENSKEAFAACRTQSEAVNWAASAASMTFWHFNQNGIWETNAEMYIRVMNLSKAMVSAVGGKLYNANGSLLKSYSKNCSHNTSYVNYIYNINYSRKK